MASRFSIQTETNVPTLIQFMLEYHTTVNWGKKKL